jgi:hypothetical protein
VFLQPNAAVVAATAATSQGAGRRLRPARAALASAASAYGMATPSDSVRLRQISPGAGAHMSSAATHAAAGGAMRNSASSHHSVAAASAVQPRRHARQQRASAWNSSACSCQWAHSTGRKGPRSCQLATTRVQVCATCSANRIGPAGYTRFPSSRKSKRALSIGR